MGSHSLPDTTSNTLFQLQCENSTRDWGTAGDHIWPLYSSFDPKLRSILYPSIGTHSPKHSLQVMPKLCAKQPGMVLCCCASWVSWRGYGSSWYLCPLCSAVLGMRTLLSQRCWLREKGNPVHFSEMLFPQPSWKRRLLEAKVLFSVY